MNDEQLWNRYNSNAKVGMSAEEIARAQAYGAANGKVFDGTVTQTEQDRRKSRDAAAVASRTPEQQEAMKQIYAEHNETKDNTPTLQQAVEGVKGIGSSIAKGVEDVTKDANLAEDPNYQIAGYGGVNKSLTDSSSGASGGNNGSGGNNKDPGNAAGDLAETNPQETKRYANSMMGIWDAFREGKIDQGTALYFTLDSIAKLARNTGKDLNNIAAAFTGGTMNNEREDSLWGQRRNKMFENELAGEVESQTGSPAYRAMQHDLNSLSMEQKNLIAKDIENYIAEHSKNLTVSMLAKQLEAMGYANIASQFNTFTQKELLQMANSNDPAEAAIAKGLISASHANVTVGPTGVTIGTNF